jgi:hypothetical protein
MSGGRGLAELLAPRLATEHFHIIYHLPNERISIPYFKHVFESVRESYLAIQAMGRQAEPQTEWYEDGTVGFETPLPGRVGRFWVVLQATGCARSSCQQYMTRSQHKRSLSVVGDADPVPLVAVPEGAVVDDGAV